MTHEGERDTVAWVEKHSVAYSYAYDPKGGLFRWFGVSAIPDAVLIDPFGTIVWRGNPGSLTEETVEGALKGALPDPLWTWPEETRKVKQMLLKGKYAKALSEAQEIEGEYGDIVQARITHLVQAVTRAHEEGDILLATELGESASKDLRGLPEAETVEGILSEMKGDDEAKHVLEGQKELAKLNEEAATANGRKKLSKLIGELRDLRKEYADTLVATRAEGAIRSLEKRLSKIG